MSSLVRTLYFFVKKCFPSLLQQESMCIHIIGSRFTDVIGTKTFEALFHSSPILKHIHLMFSGPELFEEDMETEHTAIHLCDQCIAKGRKMVVTSAFGLYDDSVFANQKPDLAFLPNAGLFLYPSWRSSLQLLICNSVPTIITSHDRKDAVSDVRVLQDCHARVCLQPVENVAHGAVPVRRPENLAHVYYRNWYVFGFKGRRKSS
mmetsp:Transcript_359/g.710  ORF Transcript_359/g.710 Transcript_359/m.710 type:complete len:205 (+) Transcript_359:634-1248(+)